MRIPGEGGDENFWRKDLMSDFMLKGACGRVIVRV